MKHKLLLPLLAAAALNACKEVPVTIAPEATLFGEHRLTVLITQDSMVDYQKKGLE